VKKIRKREKRRVVPGRLLGPRNNGGKDDWSKEKKALNR